MTWRALLDDGDLSASAPPNIATGTGATGTATTVARSDHAHGFVPTADLSMAGFKLTTLGAPTNAGDAATKSYVDGLSAGLAWKASVRVATTANGTLATAYANAQTVDGVALVTGNRILIKDQTAGAENGIYTVNA